MSPRDEHELPQWIKDAAEPVDPVKGLHAWLVGATKAARVEPSAELREAARSMMEAYAASREAGFTESQAMQILMGLIQAGRRDGK